MQLLFFIVTGRLMHNNVIRKKPSLLIQVLRCSVFGTLDTFARFLRIRPFLKRAD
ncbi:hypothetical protein J2Z65_004876 [Paenibacillus aceris]|uniref:Uncharacterized protein n=1 Tax=Paenibacillus aceris TaxID=869555 RepID=A0ABS4I5E7_9BACL|nr:hypothetical protein [Paenibacillus aceris]